jgi:small subunit ribosomal protein S1
MDQLRRPLSSWTKKIKNPSSVLTESEEIDVIITNVDIEAHRIRLGVKQLSEDPWAELLRMYPKGSIIEGEVSNITDFGLFVKVQGGIEGLIHKNNLSEDRDADADEMLGKYKVGEKISASVIELQPGKQKLSLSVKEMKLREQKKEISKYIHEENGDDSTYTLADMLKDKES